MVLNEKSPTGPEYHPRQLFRISYAHHICRTSRRTRERVVVGSKERNCQSEHDAPVDRPHCDPRTTHYENRAGVSLDLVPTRARIHQTFICPHGDRSLFYSRMINLALLPHTTKQHGNHYCTHPRDMLQERPGVCPAPATTLVPAFPPGLELGAGLPRGGFPAAVLAALPPTWHREHSSCITVSPQSRWLDRQVCSQVIG